MTQPLPTINERLVWLRMKQEVGPIKVEERNELFALEAAETARLSKLEQIRDEVKNKRLRGRLKKKPTGEREGSGQSAECA